LTSAVGKSAAIQIFVNCNRDDSWYLHERVKNFDQIEVGDVVTAQYQEETAIFVRPSTGSPTINGISHGGCHWNPAECKAR
jgi:hypothetical protein